MDTKQPDPVARATPPADAPVTRHASQRDELLQVALDFIGTLTGMSPPPIETAPPEVFGPFYAFVDRVQAITAPQVQADALDADVQRDAERYRWLRNEETDWYVGPSYSTYNDNVCDGEYRNFFGVELDKAIDAARAAQGGV